MFKVLENYLEERHAQLCEHDTRAVEVNFPIPSVFSCWHIYDASPHFVMVYFRLHCGQAGRGNLRKAFEKASDAIGRRDISFCFLELEAYGINEKVPCLITALEIKEEAKAFARNADQTILDMARIALGMSPSFTPASGRRYDLSGLMLLGIHLGFDTVYEATKPEVVFRRKEVQSQGTKMDELNSLRERVERKIEDTKKRIQSLENLDTQTKPSADWKIKTDLTFQDISGMEELKDDVRRQVIWPLLNPDKMSKYKLKMPAGMILHGEPGTGKTFFCQALAGEIGCSFREISSADFGSKYLHESSNLIHQIFLEAKRHAPAILLFDEIDAYMGIRGSAEMEKQGEEVSAFLAELQECGNNRVFVVGTTNFVQNIDPAITRSGRLDLMFEVKAPDAAQREQLFTDSLKKRPRSRKLDIARLVSLSESSVAADIVYAVNDAAMSAAIENRRIMQHDLEEAIMSRVKKTTAPVRKIGFKTLA